MCVCIRICVRFLCCEYSALRRGSETFDKYQAISLFVIAIGNPSVVNIVFDMPINTRSGRTDVYGASLSQIVVPTSMERLITSCLIDVDRVSSFRMLSVCIGGGVCSVTLKCFDFEDFSDLRIVSYRLEYDRTAMNPIFLEFC